MARLVREISVMDKKKKTLHSYISIKLTNSNALKIFGPRVFDMLRKHWIEDDHKVIWGRTIGLKEAEYLRQTEAIPNDFQFDFEKFDYALITSKD